MWTSGGSDNLEIYRRLGIGGVWFWKASRIEVHLLPQDRLGGDQSSLFPDLDLELLCSFLDRPMALQAGKAFREALGR